MADVRPETDLEDRSLGELVAQASSNVSSLIRSELELAKLELKSDAQKAALGGTLFAVAGVIACVVLILASITLALGIEAMGIWSWAAFGIVTLAYLVLGAVLVLFGYLRLRRMSGLKRTLRTTKDDLAMLRRSEPEDVDATEVLPAAGRKAVGDEAAAKAKALSDKAVKDKK